MNVLVWACERRVTRNKETFFLSCLDPVSVVRRQEALEAARLRMQAELDAKAAEFKEKQQQVRVNCVTLLKGDFLVFKISM